MQPKLKAPFPWFGGKSRAAHLVWERFGDVPNYVEPFFGSGAVLLGRPHTPGTETVNDLDCYLANFWRALQANPKELAIQADWPVNEADLVARHKWLVKQTKFREKLRMDPNYFDCKIAGWWVWGRCIWIGSGWCNQNDKGLSEQLPHLSNGGMGINRKLPHLSDGGRTQHILAYFSDLSARLRDTRVACGEWDRVLTEAVTTKHGVTGVFLDPPYSAKEHSIIYSANSDVSFVVREWAIANGGNPLLRIALCGYDGEHDMPEGWELVTWKATGGYSIVAAAKENALRERIWFSPACNRRGPLF